MFLKKGKFYKTAVILKERSIHLNDSKYGHSTTMNNHKHRRTMIKKPFPKARATFYLDLVSEKFFQSFFLQKQAKRQKTFKSRLCSNI